MHDAAVLLNRNDGHIMPLTPVVAISSSARGSCTPALAGCGDVHVCAVSCDAEVRGASHHPSVILLGDVSGAFGRLAAVARAGRRQRRCARDPAARRLRGAVSGGAELARRDRARLGHRLAQRYEFPGVTDTQLETDRFSSAELTQPGNKLKQADR